MSKSPTSRRSRRLFLLTARYRLVVNARAGRKLTGDGSHGGRRSDSWRDAGRRGERPFPARGRGSRRWPRVAGAAALQVGVGGGCRRPPRRRPGVGGGHQALTCGRPGHDMAPPPPPSTSASWPTSQQPLSPRGSPEFRERGRRGRGLNADAGWARGHHRLSATPSSTPTTGQLGGGRRTTSRRLQANALDLSDLERVGHRPARPSAWPTWPPSRQGYRASARSARGPETPQTQCQSATPASSSPTSTAVWLYDSGRTRERQDHRDAAVARRRATSASRRTARGFCAVSGYAAGARTSSRSGRDRTAEASLSFGGRCGQGLAVGLRAGRVPATTRVNPALNKLGG